MITNQYPEEMIQNSKTGHGLSGTVNLDNGEYSMGGAAATKFWINPTDNLIVICYTQLFQAETDYANEFKATIDRAWIDQ